MDEEFQEIQGIIGDIVSNTVKQVVCLLRMDKEISDLPGSEAISIWRCEGISEDDIRAEDTDCLIDIVNNGWRYGEILLLYDNLIHGHFN